MQKVNIKELADKFSAGNCTKEELAILENWYLQWQPEDYHMDSNRLDTLMKSVLQEMPVGTKHKTFKLWLRYAGIAAAVAAITLGTWLYVNEIALSRKASRNDEVVRNDIGPGKNTATLTLANGKTIELNGAKTGVVIGKDKLAYNDGSLVGHPELVSGSLTSHAIMLTASTPRGGTYQITLPDGTHVWLNADSKISFPSQFSGKIRKILLSGEAYFEVSKNKRMPFIIESNGQTVEVLGTHFNINAYEDEESIKTTLLEGSVRVSPVTLSSGQHDIVLKPSEQSSLSSNNQFEVKQVDASETIAWKNGDFVFKEETVESIMRKVARWYDVEVRYAPNAPKGIALGGVVSRSRNVSAVLKMMQLTNRVDFKIEGRTITVLPAKNNGPNQP